MAVTLKSDDLGGLGQRVEGAHLTLCSPKSDALRPLRRHLGTHNNNNSHLGTLCGEDPLLTPPTIVSRR